MTRQSINLSIKRCWKCCCYHSLASTESTQNATLVHSWKNSPCLPRPGI